MILNDGFFIEGNMARVIKYGGIKEGRIEEYREYQDNLKEILEIENIIAILLYYRDLLFSKGNGCNKLVILPNFEMENTYTSYTGHRNCFGYIYNSYQAYVCTDNAHLLDSNSYSAHVFHVYENEKRIPV